METRPFGVQCETCLSRMTEVCQECGKVMCSVCAMKHKYSCPRCGSKWTMIAAGSIYYKIDELKNKLSQRVLDPPNDMLLSKKPFWQSMKSYKKRIIEAYKKSLRAELDHYVSKLKMFEDEFREMEFKNKVEIDKMVDQKRKNRERVTPEDFCLILSNLATAERNLKTALNNLENVSRNNSLINLYGSHFRNIHSDIRNSFINLQTMIKQYKAIYRDEAKQVDEASLQNQRSSISYIQDMEAKRKEFEDGISNNLIMDKISEDSWNSIKEAAASEANTEQKETEIDDIK